MKRVFLTFSFLSAIICIASAQTILGIWTNENNTSRIEFYQSGNSYSAKLVWLQESNDKKGNPKLDKNNPDEKLRSRKVVGSIIIWGLNFQSNKWTAGTIYNPEKGVMADCVITMPDANTLKMKASKGVFSVVKIWKRLK